MIPQHHKPDRSKTYTDDQYWKSDGEKKEHQLGYAFARSVTEHPKVSTLNRGWGFVWAS